MQRHGVQISGPIFSNNIDTHLYDIQQTLENNYWVGKEGVFNFQFISTDSAISNTSAPFYFNILRYSPTWQEEAWTISQDGVLNGDGTIEYADGIKGKLIDNDIHWAYWNGYDIWKKVSFVPPYENPLDLDLIDKQASADTQAIGRIMNKHYYY